MQDVAVIDDPDVAEIALEPVRARLLAELTEPGSASSLAPTVGLTRQKVNYHLRALESRGLIELVEERRKGNMTERVMRATAAAYVISPLALSAIAPDPGRSPDQLSASWLVALGSRTVGEVGELMARSTRAGQPLATFAIDAEVEFASASDRASFAAELTSAFEKLVAKYHHRAVEGGRKHRVVVGLHPMITRPESGVGPTGRRATP
jgi:DNA-binding transcriptional ArsR family regulator